jgi:selenide,water dikinase
LAQVLRRLHNLPATRHPDLMVGVDASDDAGVLRVSDDLALVQTVDFFTPIVDEADDWGRIAAANALSDVYAMGATPATALQIVGWPRDDLPLALLGDVLEGAAEVLSAAGCTLVGGHSIDDKEPKYGLAVTGFVHPDDLVMNAAAAPGDSLVLTKAIGTGIVTTAIKQGAASQDERDEAVRSMIRLNAPAATAMRRVGVRAATDVTGFGLLGHLAEIVRVAGVSADVDAGAVPLLPGARRLAAAGFVPGGTKRNLAAVTPLTTFGTLDETNRTLLADAQTSGGMLIAVEAPLTAALVQALEDEGVTGRVVGRLTERSFSDGPSGQIRVH